MRYTTPEWLLENLEKRVRLALGDRTSNPEQLRTAGAKAGNGTQPNMPSSATPTAA